MIVAVMVLLVSMMAHGEQSQLISSIVTTSGPAFAAPATDSARIYAASGFSTDCKGSARVYAFDRSSLDLIWVTVLEGAIGDTTLVNINGALIFGVGDGVAAISTSDGKLLWRRPIGGCFQESFLGVDKGRVFIGNNLGQLVALTFDGQILWSAKFSGAVFGAPAALGDAIIVADMSNTITALDSEMGEKLWERTLPAKRRVGIFAGPRVEGENIYVGTYSGELWRLDKNGRIKARYQGEQRFVAQPAMCGGDMVAADLGTRLYWLDTLTLKEKASLDIDGRFLFGSVQCYQGSVVVTTYGAKGKPSTLYLLRRGKVMQSIDFPCCLNALSATRIERGCATNVLTTLSGAPVQKMQVVRTSLANGSCLKCQ
jgi:outer membrane protein assembly factor BamB